jgi:hypothetical protein
MTSVLDISKKVGLKEMSNKEIAREWLSIGVNPIPLIKGTKQASIKWSDYQEQRVSISEIDEWWSEPNKFDVGIITGQISGISVIDLDTSKTDKMNGWDSINYKDIKLPKDGLVTRTQNGGFHVFLAYDERLKNGVNILDNVDIRNDGGYVKVSGNYSILKGKINRDYFPKFYDESLVKKSPNYSVNTNEIPEPYRKYLNAVEGERNNAIASLTGTMIVDGYTRQLDCYMTARKVNQSFSPPLEDIEVSKCVSSVFKTADRKDEIVNQKDWTQSIVSGSYAMKHKVEKEWVWDYWIPKKLVTLFSGFEGKGKSMALLDICKRITNGEKFPDGSKSNKGKVLWLGFEEGVYDDMTERIKTLGLDPELIRMLDWTALEENPSLYNEFDRDILQNYIIENDIVLTIIDPINAMSFGLKDNESKEVSRFIKQLAKITSNTNTGMVLVAHWNKDSGKSKTASHMASGSHQWGASCKSHIMLSVEEEADHTESLTKRRISQQKTNSKRPDTLVLELSEKDGSVTWSKGGKHFDLISHMNKPSGKKDECVEDIVDLIKVSDLSSKDLHEKLEEKGHKNTTINRSITFGNEMKKWTMTRCQKGHTHYYHLESEIYHKDIQCPQCSKNHFNDVVEDVGDMEIPKQPSTPITPENLDKIIGD